MTEIPSLWTVGLRRNSAIGDYTNRNPQSETHDGQIQRTAVERWLSFVFFFNKCYCWARPAFAFSRYCEGVTPKYFLKALEKLGASL